MFEDIQQQINLVEEELLKGLDDSTPYLDKLAKHIFSSGGKRVRPAMAIYASLMFRDAKNDPDDDFVYQAAAALEYLHTATLLHDDVVDEATERRGHRTARMIWNNAPSVLVGDYLLALSFRKLTKLGDLGVLDVISDTTMMMARGELFQLASSCDTANEGDYLNIIHCKTACLFGAAVQIGAIFGGAGEQAQQSLYQYGLEVGMAFQMVDDALDYVAGREEVGKPLGMDFRERKITMPLSRLLTVANEAEKSELRGFLQSDESSGESSGDSSDQDIKRVVELMQKYEIDSYTRNEAAKRVEHGLAILNELPPGKSRDSLVHLAKFVVERNF